MDLEKVRDLRVRICMRLGCSRIVGCRGMLVVVGRLRRFGLCRLVEVLGLVCGLLGWLMLVERLIL